VTLHGRRTPNLVLLLQRLVREQRVARAEDAVVPELDAALLLQGVPYIDLREDPEALLLQLILHALDRRVEREGHERRDRKSVV